GEMALGNFRLAAAQPDAAHREAGEALAFLDARLLQQGQRRAAGAQEYVARADRARLAGLLVLDVEPPAALGPAVQVGLVLVEMDGEAVLPLEVGEQVAGERAVVEVGPGHHARGGTYLGRVAAFHEKRRPFADLLVVLGKLHAAVEVMRAHRRVALPE